MKNKNLRWLQALLFIIAATLIFSCGGETGAIAGDAKAEVLDPEKEYPVTITIYEGKFVDGTYSIAAFEEDASLVPTATANPPTAKKGKKVAISINDVPAGYMQDGLNSKVSAKDGSHPALSKTNQFTMPAGPANVTLVFMHKEDFLLSDAAYDNSLYTLEIDKGELGSYNPPMTTEYAEDDGTGNPVYWSGNVAYSGYSNDGKKTVIDVYPSNSGAASAWNFKDNNPSLVTRGSGDNEYQVFFVQAKVKPQVFDVYTTLDNIPSELRDKLTADGISTVAERYAAAKEKSYYFEIMRRTAATNAYLKSLIISTVSQEFSYSGQAGPKDSLSDKYAPVIYDNVEAAAGSLELNVTAESEDGNAFVRIDNGENNQAFQVGGNTNYVSYAAEATTVSFDIWVQAEEISQSKKYTVNVVNAPQKYSLAAEGGSVYFIETKDDQDNITKVEEVHSFFIGARDTVALGAQKTFELKFFEAKPAAVEILVVAGGGAGAGSGASGGGGGGGVIHYTNYTLPGNGLAYPVKVGNGGAVRTATADRVQSGNGGNSQFGSDNETYRLMAPGGGGGGAVPTSGEAYRGADGGNGGGGAQGANISPWNKDWGPHDDLASPKGRALVTNFHYNGADQLPDNNKAFPTNTDAADVAGGDIAATGCLDTNVEHYKVEHPGNAFGNKGGWAGGISDVSGGSGAGTPAWYRTTAGRNSSNAGGQGIMFNTSGQWRWYASGGPGGYRCWGTIGQGANSAGTPQSGNGGANGNPGGSGTVIVKWERTDLLNTEPVAIE